MSWLIYSFDYPPSHGGIARLCAEIARATAKTRQKVEVLTQVWPKSNDGNCSAEIPEVRLNSKRLRREVQAWRALRKKAPDSLLICGIWYPEGFIATLASVHPRVIMAHGLELMPTRSIWRRPIWRGLQRRVLESADLVIANSLYTLNLVRETAPRCKAAAVPLAVDHLRFSPGDRESAKLQLAVSDRRVLCSVSRLHRYKAHDIVFQALALLPDEHRTKFVYLIAGEGPHEHQLKKQARELGVDTLVRWLGFVSEDRLPDLYRAADLFILCTREEQQEQAVEGFGLVFLEAQACGTPVVGARTGGIPEAVSPGEGGWLIDQDDVQALSQILRRLVANPEEFRAMGRAGRERVEREYTWERYKNRFIKALGDNGIFID